MGTCGILRPMRRGVCLALGWVVACATTGEVVPPRTELPATGVEFSAGGVEVMLNGSGPYTLGFDTGQSIPILVTPELAATLGLETISQIPIGDGSTQGERTADVVSLERVEFAGAVFRNVTGVVLESPEHGPEGQVGALGFPLFEEVLLTVDGDRVQLEAGELPEPDGDEILAYQAPQFLPTIEIDLAGQPVRAVLDSANPKFLTLPLAMSATLPLAEQPRVIGRMATLFNEFDVLGAPLAGQLTLGAHRFSAPELEFNDVLPDPNVGRGLSGLLRVTFDQRNLRVRLSPRRLASAVEPASPSLVPVGRPDYRAAAAGWQGSDAWLDQHNDCRAVAAAGRGQLVLLGDSITQSFGGPGRRVWSPGQHAREASLGRWPVANLGISGDRTQHLLWRIDQGTLEGLSPRFAAVLIGTNNVSAGDSAAEIAAGVERVVERVLEALPEVHVLVQGLLPRGAPEDPERTAVQAVNRHLAALGVRRQVTYRDFGPRFLERDGRLRIELYGGDGLHLSPSGYGVWARALADTLAALDGAQPSDRLAPPAE